MCGRFTLAVEKIVIEERFNLPLGRFEWHPRYNIAPTQPCPTVIIENNQRTAVPMIWGLVPHWSKHAKSGYQMVNARAETVKSKASFRTLFQRRRCLVPADGFYEWVDKHPYRAAMKNEGVFAFAGLWDHWQGEKGEEVTSFTILTTDANVLLRQLHDRMPVILKKEDEALWLDPTIEDPAKLEPLLVPYSAEEMVLYPVSSIVNSWRNDRPECIKKIDKE